MSPAAARHDVFEPSEQSWRDLRDTVDRGDQRVEVIVVESGEGGSKRPEVSVHRAILRHWPCRANLR